MLTRYFDKGQLSNLANNTTEFKRGIFLLKSFIHIPNSTSRKRKNLPVWRLRDRTTAAFHVVIGSLSSRQSETEIIPLKSFSPHQILKENDPLRLKNL